MDAVKVDEAKGIHLEFLRPGDYYLPEIISDSEVRLRKVQTHQETANRDAILRAIEDSPLKFTGSWDDLKTETRG